MADEKMTLGKLAEENAKKAAAHAETASYNLDVIITDSVSALLRCAVLAEESADALRFSQAALNTANVKHSLGIQSKCKCGLGREARR